MKCSGVSTSYQDWFCPMCGYQESIKKSSIKPMEKDNKETQCPVCGCVYDDKAIGTQGRDVNCDCWCQHQSWFNSKGTMGNKEIKILN